MAQKTKKTDAQNGEMKWPFTKINYLYFGIALLLMIVGYLMLGQGSDAWAPVILVIAYCIVLPIAIMKREKSEPETTVSTEE